MRLAIVCGFGRYVVAVGRVYRNDVRSGYRRHVLSIAVLRGLNLRGWGVAVTSFPARRRPA